MRLLLAISIIIFLYDTASMIWPLKLSLPVKFCLAALLLAASFKDRIFQKIGGGMFFAPDLPRSVVITGSLLYNFLVMSLFLLVFKDSIHLLWKIFLRRPFPSADAAAAVMAVSAVLTAWGTWQAYRVPDVKHYDVTLPGLARGFDGKTAAVLADLHCSASNRRSFIQAVVSRTNAQKPDLVLMPGDFVDGLVSQRRSDLEPLSQFKAPLGVYGTSGNHEYYSGYSQWKKELESFGIRILENQHAVLSAGNGRLVIAGTPDPQGGRYGYESPDLAKALKGAPAGVPVILLAHRPDTAPESARAGIVLQVSGHTHGGMLPLLDKIVAKFNNGYVRGWYSVNGMQLFTSPGTSLWNGFPMQINDPAEITILTLHSAE